MPSPAPIDILAALRAKGMRQDPSKSKSFISWSAPSVFFAADEGKLAEDAAKTISHLISTSLLAGQSPDGTALPPLSPATIRRREYRDAQWARTGAVWSKDAKGRTRARWTENGQAEMSWAKQKRAHRRAGRLRRRYKTSRLGLFDPTTMDNTTRGVESGMLAKSVFAKPSRYGTWSVYFADNRARIDRSGKSAVDRVLGTRVESLASAVQNSPEMQRQLQIFAQSLVTHRRAQAAGRLLREARRTVGIGKQIVEQAEQLAEETPED